MPATSGFSHGFAAFTSILLGTFISNYLSAHQTMLTEFTRVVGESVIGALGLGQAESVAGMLLISSILAFLWGVAYHLACH